MASSSEDERAKQPIKRLEIPISKFNDVAVPHHLDLLKKHKNNMKKSQANQNWDQVYKEQINASRVVKQLKQLLYEMDTLRSQVLESDIIKFDKLTAKARSDILDAIKEYLRLELNLSAVQQSQPESNNQPTEMPFDGRFIQIQAEQEDLERQQACLNAWTNLQTELQQLQQLFVDFNKVVHEQAEQVDRIEDNVEEAGINVENGLTHLKDASRYKVMAYPLAGAIIGTCLGGPVGFFAGMKFGGLTAIGGGLLGLKCGSFIKEKSSLCTELKQIEGVPESEQDGNTPKEVLDQRGVGEAV